MDKNYLANLSGFMRFPGTVLVLSSSLLDGEKNDKNTRAHPSFSWSAGMYVASVAKHGTGD